MKETKVHFNIEEGEFKGFSLQRESFQGQTFSFGSLSGGTREQVASAVRLAMAEVLAEAHDGCLPLVFDDAFVNADPKRTADLQSMLYLAGDRGLQIIVLTCTPADYTNLGAKLVILDNPSRVISQALMPSENGDSQLRENAEIVTPDLERLQDELVSSLRLLGGKSGNQTLCEQLGWDKEMYSFVKDRLIENGILKPGKGRGGSVAIADN